MAKMRAEGKEMHRETRSHPEEITKTTTLEQEENKWKSQKATVAIPSDNEDDRFSVQLKTEGRGRRSKPCLISKIVI